MSEWGPWIEHDGKGCPCVGEFVHFVIGPDGDIPVSDAPWEGSGCGFAISHDEWMGIIIEDDEPWRWCPGYYPIIRYRIRRPKGLTILENLIAEIPEEVEVGE